jgi:hypothetical protein
LIDAAAAMGVDVFTIDDGWQQEYGDNGVNLTSFPRRLATDPGCSESQGHAAGAMDTHGRHWHGDG